MRARDRHRTAREPTRRKRRHSRNRRLPSPSSNSIENRSFIGDGPTIWDGICPIATALINTKRISDLDLIRELALLGSARDMTRKSGAGQPVAPCAQEFFLQNFAWMRITQRCHDCIPNCLTR